MTMKITAIILASYIGVISGAPAIVWKSGGSPSGPVHISEAIDARSLLSSSIDNSERDSALAAVVFLVGRNADGSEGLAFLSASDKIPLVQEKYAHANVVHHHVEGVESARTVARDARLGGVGSGVVEVALEEFHRKLSSIAQIEDERGVEGETLSKSEQRRRRVISEADVLIVKVRAEGDAAKIDAAVVAAIESSVVRNVVLSSIRSVKEIKHARRLAVLSKFSKSRRASVSNGRRLEDEAADEEENNNNQNQEGGYYVNMTPNIFAGLLFFLQFTFTAYLGLTCMNMIEGQDVFLVKKYPHNGREA